MVLDRELSRTINYIHVVYLYIKIYPFLFRCKTFFSFTYIKYFLESGMKDLVTLT